MGSSSDDGIAGLQSARPPVSIMTNLIAGPGARRSQGCRKPYSEAAESMLSRANSGLGATDSGAASIRAQELTSATKTLLPPAFSEGAADRPAAPPSTASA